MKRILATAGVVALPAILIAAAFAAQDRYSVQVPGGLAFAEFKGYEDWQVIAVSHNGDKVALIVGNPAMIEAYKAGVPGNGKPFPDGAMMAKLIGWPRRLRTSPASPSCRVGCTTSTSW